MKEWIHQRGHKGQEIVRLQKALGGLDLDGAFGPKTEAALKQFQSQNNIDVTGKSSDTEREILEIEIYSGIDVSKWNGNVDWLRAESSGQAQFCWIKATEGNNYLCPMFEKHVAAATTTSIPIGAYHFARPDLHLDPHKEVKNFVKHTKSIIAKGNLRPVLDFEEAGAHSPDSIRNWVLTFLKEYEIQSGVRPIVYTGGNMTKYYLMSDTTGIDDYVLWHAYYPKSIKKGVKKSRLGGWKEWRVWQWTASGKVDGIKGNVDRNWLTGDKKGLKEIIIQ